MTDAGSVRGLRRLWAGRSPLIGMIHLPALPGAPGASTPMRAVVDGAVADARRLEEAGFDGVMVENYGDTPFWRAAVPPITVSALSVVATAVTAATSLPVGINVLRNDAAAALSIAAVTGARFIRVNVHTGSMWTDQGLIEGDAASTMRQRRALDVEVAVFADVHVKHAVPPPGSDIASAAEDTWHRGAADALIVSGRGTGIETDLDDLGSVRAAVPSAAILVGSGASEANARRLLARADGLIVGSSIMRDIEFRNFLVVVQHQSFFIISGDGNRLLIVNIRKPVF